MPAKPLAQQPKIERTSISRDAGPQAAILFEALEAERRKSAHWKAKAKAAQRARNRERRPYISQLCPRDWHAPDGTTVNGIGLMAGRKLLAHLTPDEALKLSDRLVDLAERIRTGEENQ